MFEWLPIFHGKYFTYMENIFVVAMYVIPTLVVTFGSIGLWLNRPKRKSFSKQSLGQYSAKPSIQVENDEYYDATSDSSNSFTSDTMGPNFNSDTELLNPKTRSSGTRAGNACIWIAWFCISILPGVMATFRIVFPMWFAAILDLCIIGLRIRYKERKDKVNLYNKLKQKDKLEAYETQLKPFNKFYRRMKIFAVVFTLILAGLFDGFCVSSFQDYVGPIFGSASLSSRFTRYFQLGKACPIGPPCHIYASLPEETATSVFINAHTHESYETITIRYDLDSYYQQNNGFRYSGESVSYQLSGMESNGVRRVHSTLLNDLKPDSLYHFEIIYGDAVQASGNYKTLPDETSTRDLVIVQGGDMGNTAAARKVVESAAKMNPDVVVIGGDMAYDNGMCTCYFAWDFWLKDMKQINDATGRLVPLILAAGNHDMGIDPIPERRRTVDTEGPFYMVLFPQHFRRMDNVLVPGVPDLHERSTYYYHKLGKALLVTLDSGYLADVEGEQVEFMHSVLNQYPSHVKFGHYHCPIYYACDDLQKFEMESTAAQYRAWTPVFDKYKFALVFENDEHQMKRTFPLRNNQTHPKGTLYVGNGEWGTDEGYECHSSNNTGLYEHVGIIHHYWVVNISSEEGKIYNTAYNKWNEVVIPTKSQDIKDYIMDE